MWSLLNDQMIHDMLAVVAHWFVYFRHEVSPVAPFSSRDVCLMGTLGSLMSFQSLKV